MHTSQKSSRRKRVVPNIHVKIDVRKDKIALKITKIHTARYYKNTGQKCSLKKEGSTPS